jgi:hypothetical protein
VFSFAALTTVSKTTKRLDARQTCLLVRKDAVWTAHLSSTAHLSQRLPINEQLASVPPLLFTAICLLRLHAPACDPAPTSDNATSNDREPIVPETTLSAYLRRLRRRARRALPSRLFSSIPLLSIESGIRWNRTLHCRGESRSPFRVKTGHFSIYVYVYVTHCLIIQLKLLGCENDVLIMTTLDLPFSSRVLAVSCAPFSFSTPFRLFLQCVSRHRRGPCSASALVLPIPW